MRISLMLVGTLILAGCAERGPVSLPKIVPTPVPVSCVPADFPKPPSGLLEPADVAAMPAQPSSLDALAADWLVRWAWEQVLEKQVARCQAAAPAPK